MSWWRRVFGLDGFDLAMHGVLTGLVLFAIGVANGRFEDVAMFGSLALGSSFLILAVRRRLALNKAERLGGGELEMARLAELEQRVAELELDSARLAELEERLDFTERLLTRAGVERPELLPGRSPDG